MSVPDLTEQVPQPIKSAGSMLADKRKEWDLSIHDVAASLNLGVDTIESLESDDYERLPGTTFVKGYIRSYARLLKLDAENLMDNIDLQPERITEIPSTRAALKQKGKTRSRSKGERSGILKWIVIAVLLVAVIGVGLTQLPKLGIDSISELVKWPGSESDKANSNQIIIPDSNEKPAQSGALIRIE